MELTIETTCHVQKRMQTSADKADDDGEIVTCRIGVKGVRVRRETMEELGGLPIGAYLPLFNEIGMPLQRQSILFPKRELLGTGRIEHRRESGATLAQLEVTNAVVADLRFNLDVPDDEGPTSMMSFSLVWKAAGDEVDHVRFLLGQKRCFMKIKIKEPPTQVPLALDNRATAAADQPAGDRAKLDRKRRAAGERPEGSENAAPPPPPAPAPAARGAKKKQGGTMADIEREARELARKHPRRDPPKDKRKH